MNNSALNKWLTANAHLLSLLFRICLGALFIYASLDKIWHPGLFAKAVSNYRILPLPLLHASAIILPWLELTTGLALILNRYSRSANILIGSMLLCFTLAIISAMMRGLDFNCGCFDLDSDSSSVGLWKLIQNTGLIAMTFFLEYLYQKEPQHFS